MSLLWHILRRCKELRFKHSGLSDQYSQCCHTHKQANSDLGPQLHLNLPKPKDRDDRQANVSESGISYTRQNERQRTDNGREPIDAVLPLIKYE